MKNDLNKTKGQFAIELKELSKKNKEFERNLQVANQQLKLSQQKLSATEKQLRTVSIELLTSDKRFHKYFEQNLIGMTITSVNKEWIEINDAICEMLGYSKEELEKMTWVELTYADDLDADISQFNKMLAHEIEAYTVEKRFIHKDGHIVYTAVSMNAYYNSKFAYLFKQLTRSDFSMLEAVV
ncbi:MAG: hypothetical protein B6241_08880 [Spirochaetaceae bacterium 4572_59]|nr:MAG: hypothetical protein B6241_08880 [Spirochaetaceae bacterium 4572_59]